MFDCEIGYVFCPVMFVDTCNFRYLGGVAICPRCNHRFCVQCYEEAHFGLACTENPNAIDVPSLKTLLNMKVSPKF